MGRSLALLAGPLVATALWLAPAPAALPEAGWKVLGLTAWMTLWWLLEALPLAATALLPLLLLPLLGVMEQGAAASAYAHPLVFLFLGGFALAAALARWNLHRRLALELVVRFGGAGVAPGRLVGGAMLATALLSMWISNTAAAVMMYAVARSLVASLDGVLPAAQQRRFGVALMLGVAYSASIGGLATLVGTPPNALLAGYLADAHGIRLDFQRWLGIGLPLAALLLPLCWWWLTRLAFPLGGLRVEGAGARLRTELAALGPLTTPEWRTLAVFAATALAWVTRPQLAALTGLPLSDAGIAVAAALLLFALPSGLPGTDAPALLDWEAMRTIAWDVLLLVGGGLALAAAFEAADLGGALGNWATSLAAVPPALLVALLAALVMLLGEFASNTASAATLLPITGAVALGLGLDPLLLTVPVALAASANFMMPVATPPNAVVFGYEGLRVVDMVRAGALLDVVALALIWLLAVIRW